MTNTSGSAIDLRDRHGCTPGYAVGLTNAALPAANAPGFAAVCGTAALTLPPGTTRFPIEVITTYFGCTNGPTPSGGSHRLPQCITGGPPPLPSGRYVAVLYGSSLALPPVIGGYAMVVRLPLNIRFAAWPQTSHAKHACRRRAHA
ncbi:MAG: hypothetical protein ACYCV7_10465 [Acidimicrobiales bacterium]